MLITKFISFYYCSCCRHRVMSGRGMVISPRNCFIRPEESTVYSHFSCCSINKSFFCVCDKITLRISINFMTAASASVRSPSPTMTIRLILGELYFSSSSAALELASLMKARMSIFKLEFNSF